jgi:hypothetical protein
MTVGARGLAAAAVIGRKRPGTERMENARVCQIPAEFTGAMCLYIIGVQYARTKCTK